MFVSRFRNLLHLIFLIASVSIFFGCAAPPKPSLTGLVPGREVDTLQSTISISIHTSDGSRGGRGYLIFKRPDRFHLAILSPFGLTMLEMFSAGDRLTCLLPSKQVAYAGSVAELPDREGLRSWGLMRWVVEQPPASGPALERDHVMADGRRERIYYDEQGLITRKESEEGDRVVYREYQAVNGVAFPSVIELSTSREDTVRITFDEPEVNQPVEDAALQPNLEGVSVLPFTAFKGF